MPFDALVAPSRPKTLSEVLLDHGVVGVNQTTLEAHKEAQLQRFAPSFWYRHQTLLPTALLGSIGCMAFSSGLAQRMLEAGSPVSGWLTLGWMGVIAMLIVAGVFRVRAGSQWEERWILPTALFELGVPRPIATVAYNALRALPGAALILGELKQEYVVLDPYLLLEWGGESVCLGIWDGDALIACADRAEG